MRNSFVFYRSFYEAIRELPRDVQGEVYSAIMEYGLNGECRTEQLKPIARSVFILIKPLIDKNNARYGNGCKGGRPKNENQTETKAKPNNNQAKTKSKPDDDEDVNKDVLKGESITTPPAPASQVYLSVDDLYSNLASSTWIDSVGMQYKLTPTAVRDYLREFYGELKLKGEALKTDCDFRSHFVNWLKIQIEKARKNGSTQQQGQQTPIITRGSKL